jgi:hypothetical protein
MPRWLLILTLMALPFGAVAVPATNSLSWHVKQNKVDANIQSLELPQLLKKIGSATGWKVYIEPGTTLSISAKFKNLSEDDALHRLLGNLNYLRDETNGVERLRVFQTVSAAATEVVPAGKKDYRIADELLVKLKRGPTNAIDDLAKKLGAKILKRDDKIGFYQLQFPDGSTADAAQLALASDPSVAAVDGNYVIDPPSLNSMTQAGGPAGPNITLNPPDAKGDLVGLIDTSVDPPSQYQKYMLTPINVTGQTDPPSDMPSHGTSMLETLVNGMAVDPSMVQPIVIYGQQDETTDYDLIEGIVTAVDKGAKLISISSGGTENSPMLGDVIQQVTQLGIPITAAAGNTPGTADTYPAAYPGVTAVTASSPNGQLASYADDGSFVKMIEPGTAPVVFDGTLWQVEGTSPATATAAGQIIALANQDNISPKDAAARIALIHPPPPP